jgi:hypothetical protein
MPDLPYPHDARPSPGCILHGNVAVDYQIHKPFDSVDDAIQWLKRHPSPLLQATCSIELMEKPE